MDRKEKLEKLMLKSKRLYLQELVDKKDSQVKNLFDYRLNKDEKTEHEIKRFFHSLNGTSSVLQFATLSDIGREYEDYLDNVDGADNICDEVFSKVLEGYAKAYQEIFKLRTEFAQIKITDSEMVYDKEYTNITDSGNILIVDDDIIILDILEKSFTKAGYNVIILSEPNDVVRIAKDKKINLIILDIVMPNMNGFDVFQSIRDAKMDTPVFFLTSKDLKEDKVKALRNGVDDYITKPFDPDEVLARVERAISRELSYKSSMIEDALTGVYTKKYFWSRADEAKELLSRKGQTFSIAFIDIDYFKQINDNYGHLNGDNILKFFATELKSSVRGIDQVYRFGGDEFLVLFPDTRSEEAYKALERVRKSIKNKKVKIEGVNDDISISFSAGIASIYGETESVESLLERADKALYEGKNKGRGRTVLYDDVTIDLIDKKKILIVDDENVIVQLIRNRLISMDYEVISANDGEEGIKLCFEEKPDLMIVDLMMPKMNGYEVSRQVKNNRDIQNVKIIVLSSKKSEADIVKSFEIGVDDYVTKPFTLSELEARIRRLLK